VGRYHRYSRGKPGKASMWLAIGYPNLLDAEMYRGVAVCSLDEDHHLLIDTGGDRLEGIFPTADDARRVASDLWLSRRLFDRNSRAYYEEQGWEQGQLPPGGHLRGRRYRRVYRHPPPMPLDTDAGDTGEAGRLSAAKGG
jgi:hypothetical protein